MASATSGERRDGGIRPKPESALIAPQAQGSFSFAAHAKPGPHVPDAYQRTTPRPVIARASHSIAPCTRASSSRPKPISARKRLPFRQWMTAEGGGPSPPTSLTPRSRPSQPDCGPRRTRRRAERVRQRRPPRAGRGRSAARPCLGTWWRIPARASASSPPAPGRRGSRRWDRQPSPTGARRLPGVVRWASQQLPQREVSNGWRRRIEQPGQGIRVEPRSPSIHRSLGPRERRPVRRRHLYPSDLARSGPKPRSPRSHCSAPFTLRCPTTSALATVAVGRGPALEPHCPEAAVRNARIPRQEARSPTS